jgi:hypothetical protein
MSIKDLTDLPMAAESTKVTKESHVHDFSILVRRYVVAIESFWSNGTLVVLIGGPDPGVTPWFTLVNVGL